MRKNKLLLKIKSLVQEIEPTSKIVLYGSFARGDYRKDSDIDLLVLVDKKKISWEDEKRISFPLYGLGINSGELISVMIKTKKDWETKYRITPLYKNIQRDGIAL